MRENSSGNLRIGDEWNAISILAQSQTHPLKAVCELTENAIDAGATQVDIVRRRENGQLFLEVHDNGRGVVRTETGEPNFEHIATHVCDSMKRKLLDRKGVHGEYGIGLLSFWSIGDALEMTSLSTEGQAYRLSLRRGGPQYQIGPVRDRLQFGMGGTSLHVGPLLETTKNTLTGEKLQRYLSAELRDRIRDTGVRIRILDKVSRKDFEVTPREFEGRRLALPGHLATSSGEVRVELYLSPPGSGPTEVSLCKDGTRVFSDIAQLDAFQKSPWTDGKLQGVIDYPLLNLAPGTRNGVVPDSRLEELVTAVLSIEPEVLVATADQERIAAEEASQVVLKQVQKAFLSALRELPDHDYLYFDIPRPPKPREIEPGLRVSSYARSTRQVDGGVRLFPVQSGPLAELQIAPKNPRKAPGHACKLSATPVDVDGIALKPGKVEFKWKLVSGEAELTDNEDGTCHVTSHREGSVTVRVTGKTEKHKAVREVVIRFQPDDVPVNRGLPTYRIESLPNSSHRSTYDAAKNEVVVNSQHPDFSASKSGSARHRRYIGKLYAKEVVLLNFPNEPAELVAERLIEMLVRTEENL